MAHPTYEYAYAHPAVTTDTVVFTVTGPGLQVLLIERRNPPFEGHWALPGGFLEIDEDLDSCALRELREETGLSPRYLEQLYTFGEPRRDPRERVISVAYLALLPPGQVQTDPGSDARRAEWFSIDALPALAFDHRKIIELAHQRLAAKAIYSTLVFQLLPGTFTLTELQSVFETILEEPLDKRNFRKRTLALGELEETGEKRRNGRQRPAKTYRLRDPGTVRIIR